MRKPFILLSFILLSNYCHSQFYKSLLPSPEFSNALEKIVLDFRLNFSTIQGDMVSEQGEAETYASAIKLPGASDCVIYKYHSKADTTASWQGIMYKGDDFKEASRVYENVFRLVKKSQIRWIDKTAVSFDGELEKPAENVRFTVSNLQFSLQDKRYKNFEAEVELLSNYDNWEVHLNLQARHPDNEQPSQRNQQ